MSQRQIILFALGSIASIVAYKIYAKSLEKAALEEELQSICEDYLEKLRKEPQKRSDLIVESRSNISKFEEKSPAALNVLANSFALPPNNKLGRTILQVLTEWNSVAYEQIVSKMEKISKRVTYKVGILELGPGAGDGMDKVWKTFQDRVDYVHGYDVSKSSIKLLKSKFAQKIAKNEIWIENADIGNDNDKIIKETLAKNPRGKYDIIFHLNCFYFWDNLDICGKKLGKLLADRGVVIGGFRFRRMRRLPQSIFKNKTQDSYINMLKKSNEFDMDTLDIDDEVGGDKNFTIITIRKKD